MLKLNNLCSAGLLIAASTLLTVGVAQARGALGDNVDAFCQASDPYTDQGCSLCHTSDRGAPTEAKSAYSAGDFCYFCPTDPACDSSPMDADGDGYASDVDCNDDIAAINPGAVEVCTDRVDNDCDGFIDANDPDCGTPQDCTDNDGDGFTAEGGICGPLDCNDSDVDIYPGAFDICLDAIDQDCSGMDRTKGKGCKTTGGSGGSSEGKGKTCSDNFDNDGDGAVDCNDTNCARNRACL